MHVLQAGQLEIDVVDRWDPRKPLRTPMAPSGAFPHALSRIEQTKVDAGGTFPMMWAFGNRTEPRGEPAGDACKRQRDEHSGLVSTWSDTQFCTREVGQFGRGSASTRLFGASCGAGSGLQPQRFIRGKRQSIAANDWQWVAAWVWTPPGEAVRFRDDGDTWSYEVAGKRYTPETSELPAWTLRARLDR